MAVSSYSTTPASNNGTPPNGAPEGWAPSQINDTIRQIMADIRTMYDAASTTNLLATEVGFKGIPQNSQTSNYTCVLSDAGKHILYAAAAGSGVTFTIPANASVAYPIGTVLTFVSRNVNNLTIAITTDTLNFGSSTGSRTLGPNGLASALKTESTQWIITGTSLS